MDLGYRTQIHDWKYAYLRQVVSLSVLPETVSAFRVQRERWGRGLINSAFKHVGQMFRRPMPIMRRLYALAMMFSSFLLASIYVLLLLVLARPWFSTAALAAFMLVLVLVNNAKFRSLREPFVFQDYDYFTDAIRHPRLYIPFLGWGKFLFAALGVCLVIAVGLWAEDVPGRRWGLAGHLGAVLVMALAGVFLLATCTRLLPAPSFKPLADLRACGFLATLWQYALAGRQPLEASSPFEDGHISHRVLAAAGADDRPHLVAIQSESFFDPRSLYDGIRTDILAAFDRLQADAGMAGELMVPAWGANTVRTEFAFLSGIPAQELGVHHFNPYRAIAAGQECVSLASWLRSLGYRTICIHPYPAGFYLRDRVFPRLGFDEFLDIRAFAGIKPAGSYMHDQAVADKITTILQTAREPVFIMGITMENHGPLHLERVEQADEQRLYTHAPPAGCEGLTIYLRHLLNADQMAARLRQTMEALDRPSSLCWYGDHVPIMPAVYKTLGLPTGTVPYACWGTVGLHPGLDAGVFRAHPKPDSPYTRSSAASSPHQRRDPRGYTLRCPHRSTASIPPQRRDLKIEDLAQSWLKQMLD